MAALALIVLAPIYFLIYVVLRVELGESPIFKQPRGGYKNCVFEVMKFKTMRSTVDENGELLPDNERLTRLGRIIREASLDEIPQLFNVLKGDMSLIGPRPLISEYLDIYTKEELRRHSVLPGITGWAQVNGRNSITWKERFQLDLYYVDNCSFLLDIKVLLLTVVKTIRRESVNQGEGMTMEKYNGAN
jgi:lipopolysaccharide/colanic/teichoic acid biosynthesis glycosyltransferase